MLRLSRCWCDVYVLYTYNCYVKDGRMFCVMRMFEDVDMHFMEVLQCEVNVVVCVLLYAKLVKETSVQSGKKVAARAIKIIL